jgi:hypothetical protein
LCSIQKWNFVCDQNWADLEDWIVEQEDWG